MKNPKPKLDLNWVARNRLRSEWSRNELIKRVLWGAAEYLFWVSPRTLWGWRRFLLRLFGAKIGKNVHIYSSVKITIPWNLEIGDYAAVGDRVILYALGSIRIGERTTISQDAYLCAGTHDWRRTEFPLLKPPINIGADVWVCADAFIGPGVSVGSGAIVGARAVAMKDVASQTIVAGNPAKFIRNITT